jgi:hypothetical protein
MTGMFDDILGPDEDEEESKMMEDFKKLEIEFEKAINDHLEEVKKENRNWKPKRVLS